MDRTILSSMLKLLFVWGIVLYITVDGKSSSSKEDRIVEENGLLADESYTITSNDRMLINNDLGDRDSCISYFWHVDWATALKTCSSADTKLLCYKTKQEMDNIIEDFRLTANSTDKISLWLSNRNCSSANETEECLSLHIQKSGDTVYHYFQTNCDASFPFVCCPNGSGSDRCEDYCLNGGTCKLHFGNPICYCPSPFESVRCEKDVCAGYCMNGGKCIVESKYPRCDCQHEFKGEKCEIDSCEDFCLNGGTCSHTDYGHPTCSCTPLFEGRNCEKEICATFCKNGGICATDFGYPTCYCPPAFKGENCDVCVCGENGQCIADNGKKICICHNGYEENNGICIVKQVQVSGFERIVFIFAVVFSVLVALLALSSCLLWRRINKVSKSKI